MTIPAAAFFCCTENGTKGVGTMPENRKTEKYRENINFAHKDDATNELFQLNYQSEQ